MIGKPSRARPAVILAALLLGEAVAVGTLALGADPASGPGRALGLYGIAVSCYLCALAVHRRSPVSAGVVLVLALLIRMPAAVAPPGLSDDVWRYIHDGRAQVAGVDPYRHPPSDRATAPFRGPEHERINHPDLVTIYPPGAQVAFAIAAYGGGLAAWKALVIAADLLLVAALLRLGAGRARGALLASLYAWHPLPVLEVAWNAHLEPLALAPLAWCLVLLASRPGIAGALAGLSAAVKLGALPLIPFLARAAPRRTLAGAGLAASLLVLPYAAIAGAGIAGSLVTYARRWEFNAGLYSILLALVGSGQAARIVAALLLLLVLVAAWRAAWTPAVSAFLFFFSALLLSPVVHPWYVLWPLAVLPVAVAEFGGGPGARLLRGALLAGFSWSLTVVLAYAGLPAPGTDAAREIPAWITALEYGIPLAAFVAAVAGVRIALRTGPERSR